MVDILHRVGMRGASLDDVYEALTTIDGLSRWWTTTTIGDAGEGGSILFRFEPGDIGVRVLETVPAKRVVWQVADEPLEWRGTTITFDLRQDGEWAIVLFAHEGWAEPGEFMHHCSTKWATFLLSLKQLVETGSGSPAPDDVKVSDWH
jgi:uncharacterized protein YndB with AHSA1/START domain